MRGRAGAPPTIEHGGSGASKRPGNVAWIQVHNSCNGPRLRAGTTPFRIVVEPPSANGLQLGVRTCQQVCLLRGTTMHGTIQGATWCLRTLLSFRTRRLTSTRRGQLRWTSSQTAMRSLQRARSEWLDMRFAAVPGKLAAEFLNAGTARACMAPCGLSRVYGHHSAVRHGSRLFVASGHHCIDGLALTAFGHHLWRTHLSKARSLCSGCCCAIARQRATPSSPTPRRLQKAVTAA